MQINSNTPRSARELVGELDNVRNKFANPHQEIVEHRDELYTQGRALYERGNDLATYKENLALFQPAVATLGQLTASGGLEEVRKLALEAAQAGADNPFSFLGVSTLKNLSELAGDKLSDQDVHATTVTSLAAGLGDDPAQRGADLDKTLAHEIFITSERREALHPGAFIEGELTADKLGGLSQWMIAEQDSVGQQLEGVEQAHAQISQQTDATQHQLNDHWHSRREGFGERVDAAKVFLADLDVAEKANPDVLKEMKAEGSNGFVELRGVLQSYRSQLARHEGDVSQLDWGKLMKQLERTSLG